MIEVWVFISVPSRLEYLLSYDRGMLYWGWYCLLGIIGDGTACWELCVSPILLHSNIGESLGLWSYGLLSNFCFGCHEMQIAD